MFFPQLFSYFPLDTHAFIFHNIHLYSSAHGRCLPCYRVPWILEHPSDQADSLFESWYKKIINKYFILHFDNLDFLDNFLPSVNVRLSDSAHKTSAFVEKPGVALNCPFTADESLTWPAADETWIRWKLRKYIFLIQSLFTNTGVILYVSRSTVGLINDLLWFSSQNPTVRFKNTQNIWWVC